MSNFDIPPIPNFISWKTKRSGIHHSSIRHSPIVIPKGENKWLIEMPAS